jgi:hypothetical protein
VQYRDDHLVQLARRGGPTVICIAVGLAIVGAVVGAWAMCRTWRVVTLSAAPDGRVITHRQRSSRAPAL